MLSTYDITVSKIINTALKKIGAIADGQVLSESQLVTAKKLFAMMIEAWQQEGHNFEEIPDHWLEALSDGLSERLATQYGIYGNQLRDLQRIAFNSKQKAQDLGQELGNLNISPDLTNK